MSMRHGNRCGPQVLVPPFMSGQFHAAQSPPPCLPSPCAPLPCLPPPCAPPPCVESIFRSSGGGAARQRRRRAAPRQHRGEAVTPHRTSVRPTCSSPAQRHGRLHSGPVSHHRAVEGRAPVGGSVISPHQHGRGVARWYGPGPAPTRGLSHDDLKIVPTEVRTTIRTGGPTAGRYWLGAGVVRVCPHHTVLS